MSEQDSLAGSTPSRAIRTTLTGHLTSGSTVVQSAFGYAFRVDRTQQNKNHTHEGLSAFLTTKITTRLASSMTGRLRLKRRIPGTRQGRGRPLRRLRPITSSD
jgi:hypothetical protein